MKYQSVFMSYIVFIFVSYLVVRICVMAEDSDWNKIYISKSHLEKSKQYDKKTEYYYIRKWYDVLPDKVLTITLDLPSILYFRCWSYLEPSASVNSVVNRNGKYNIITIQNTAISGIWQCEIPKLNTANSKFMFLKIRVLDFNPPQTVFVNRIAVQTRRKELRNHNAIYYYEVGDTLNVACFLPDDECKVVMNLKSALKQLLEKEKEMWGFSIQYNFQGRHNGTNISCISKCSGFETKLKVTFMQQSKPNHSINVKINDQVVKRQSNIINYNYFLNDASLNITGESNNGASYKITGYCEFCNIIDQPDDTNSKSFIIKPNEISKVRFYATNKTDDVIEQVNIVFTPIYTQDTSSLTVNLTQANVKLSFYAYEYWGMISKSYFIYNYYDEEILKMNCSQPVAVPSTRIKINGTAQKNNNNNSYYKYIGLQKSHNNTRLSCTLEPTNLDMKIKGEIDVLFLLKPNTPSSTTLTEHSPNTTPTTGGDDGDNMKWIMIGAGIVVFICLICVFIVIYKIKIRDCHKNQTNDSCNNLENYNNAVIPPDPEQLESDYAVPEGEMYDNSLYGRNEPIYTKPIPNKFRKGKNNLTQKNYHEPCASYINSKEGLSYASLDLRALKPGSSKSTYGNQETNTVYSQIVPQNPKYENMQGRDYIEPAYSEPIVMK